MTRLSPGLRTHICTVASYAVGPGSIKSGPVDMRAFYILAYNRSAASSASSGSLA
jgi:hypothetical protein